MASIEIGQLPLTSSILNSTQIPVENANVTQKIEASAIRDFVSGSLTSLTVSGNVTAPNFVTAGNYFGTLSAETQAAITQVGSLASLVCLGNITGTNVNLSGNLYAPFVIGDGRFLTGIPPAYSNANVASYLLTNTGNIAAGNLVITNTLVGSGNTRVGNQLYVVGPSVLESTTRVHGNLVAAVETLSINATTGAIVVAGAGGLGVGGNIHVGGNLNASRSFLTLANITTANVQNLSAVAVTVGSAVVSGNVDTGNVSGTKATFTSFQGSGALLTNIPNSALVNSSITVNGSSVSLGGSVTLAAGVVSVTGTANQITANTAQGNVGLSLPQNIATTSSVQFGSFGVGTPASGTTGEIRATNNITAYFSSDAKYKENVQPIPGALSKVTEIGGKLFDWTDEFIAAHGGADGYFVRKSDFGVIGQDVQRVFPQAVRTREDGSLAVDYEKLSALAFAAIVELKQELDHIKSGLKS